MRYTAILLLLTFFPATALFAQFRGEEPSTPSVSEGYQRQSGGDGLLGMFNSDRFDMQHSVSMSYSSFGGEGLGLTMYNNHMSYRLADPLTVSADVALMFSPFGSVSQSMRENLTGIFLRQASLDYRPSKNFSISLQYRKVPYSYYYDPFYSVGPMGLWRNGYGTEEQQDLR